MVTRFVLVIQYIIRNRDASRQNRHPRVMTSKHKIICECDLCIVYVIIIYSETPCLMKQQMFVVEINPTRMEYYRSFQIAEKF